MKATIQFPIDPDLYRRDIDVAVEAAMLKVAQTWQRDYRPQHFVAGAARKYGYAPRDRYYRRRKFLKFGHNRPLVYTGLAERKSQIARITASSRRSEVRHSYLPKYFFQKRGSAPDKFEELTTVTNTEMNELARLAALVFSAKLVNARRKSSTVRKAA